jgi:hypothetical protein
MTKPATHQRRMTSWWTFAFEAASLRWTHCMPAWNAWAPVGIRWKAWTARPPPSRALWRL